MLPMRAEIRNTMPSGARITTHLKALAKMKEPNGVRAMPVAVCVTAIMKVT